MVSQLCSKCCEFKCSIRNLRVIHKPTKAVIKPLQKFFSLCICMQNQLFFFFFNGTPRSSVLTAAIAKQVSYLKRNLQAQPVVPGADIPPRAQAHRPLNWRDSGTASLVLVCGLVSRESCIRKQLEQCLLRGSDDHTCLQLCRGRRTLWRQSVAVTHAQHVTLVDSHLPVLSNADILQPPAGR